MSRTVCRRSYYLLTVFFLFAFFCNDNCGSASLGSDRFYRSNEQAVQVPYMYSEKYGYLFCNNCTFTSPDQLNDDALLNPPVMVRDLIQFEYGLNTYSPKNSYFAFNIKGSGSTTLGLHIHSFDSLKNKLVRRLPGFYNFERAIQHLQHIHTYRNKLHNLRIQTTDTQLVALESKESATPGDVFSYWQGVVYVIQPYLHDSQLAHKVLESATEETKKLLFNEQMKVVLTLFEYNKNHPHDRITLDTGLSNWEVHHQDGDITLRLNDLAQPLYEENGYQPYDWHDQASSVIWPFNGRTQEEMRMQFDKLMQPREALTQLLWGYKDHNLVAESDAYPYPDWALARVNKELLKMNEVPLSGKEVLTQFINNNYSLACLRMIRDWSSTLRYVGSFAGLTSSTHIPKPGKAQVDLYGNSQAGLVQCLLDSETAPEGWYQDSPK